MRADPIGATGPKPSTARGPRWRTAAPGFFVPADACVEQPGQRILEASLRARESGAVSGWASLHLAGAPWFEGRDALGRDLPVLLAGPNKIRAAAGVRLLRTPLDTGDCVDRHGIRCTNIHQALFDEIRTRGQLRPAVAAIDMVLHAQLTTAGAFSAWLARRTWIPRITLARQALALARPGAESPPETGLRLFWELDLGGGPLIANADIHSNSGAWLARVDLLDPRTGVIGDYDGSHHRETRQRGRDITREFLLRDHGLEYFSVVGGEIHRPQLLTARIESTLARAAANTAPARWETRIPVWREQWPPTGELGGSS